MPEPIQVRLMMSNAAADPPRTPHGEGTGPGQTLSDSSGHDFRSGARWSKETNR